MQEDLIATLAWVEVNGVVTSAELADAMRLTLVQAADRLLRLYRRKLVGREREDSSRDARHRWHYRYWITNQGVAKLRWLRGG